MWIVLVFYLLHTTLDLLYAVVLVYSSGIKSVV